MSFKQKFNQHHGQPRDKANSLPQIAALSGVSLRVLDQVYARGLGAHKTNPTSVRSRAGAKRAGGFPKSHRMSASQWGYARVYGFVMANPRQVARGKPDHDLFKKGKGKMRI